MRDESQIHPTRGEQALWRAVITQALTDGASRSGKMESQYHRSQARCWLSGKSEDFATVCDYAGLSPEYVRTQSAAALARGCKWRA